jgi:hypothetical protein
MAKNERIILDQVLQQRKAEIDPDATDSDFFELFTAAQIVKDYALSYDEIESGLVGGGHDGGIDGFYLMVNGELVQEEPDYAHLKRNVNLDLIIVQSKTGGGFRESPVERFMTASDDIFNLSKDVDHDDLVRAFNEPLRERIGRFRVVHNQLAARFPTLRVNYHYACKTEDPPGDGVKRKVEKLKDVVLKYFPNCEFGFHFQGASELLDLARQTPQTTYPLVLAENPISSEGQVGFVCLGG